MKVLKTKILLTKSLFVLKRTRQKNIPKRAKRKLESFYKFGGVYSGRVPPDPIPNSEVKPASGENSTEEARR